jgi:RNA polymerase-binding transcription factor DksA
MNMENEGDENAEQNSAPSGTGSARAAARGKGKPPAKSSDVLNRRVAASASSRIPSKWSWHYRVLRTLHRRLLRNQDRLRRDATTPLEPHSMDEADSATDEFDHDLALAQLSAKQNALYEVNQALMRLADGRYGICEATGQEIPPARLRAIPWARFIQEVEARLEKRGKVSPTRVNRAATVRGGGKIWLRHQKALEEAVDAPSSSPPANDEALSEVYSPPGQRLVPNAAGSRRAPHPEGGGRKSEARGRRSDH